MPEDDQPKCWKEPFPSRPAAERAIKAMVRRNGGKGRGKKLRPHECTLDPAHEGKWHITSARKLPKERGPLPKSERES